MEVCLCKNWRMSYETNDIFEVKSNYYIKKSEVMMIFNELFLLSKNET